jgi:hypothetical protein
MIVERCEHSVYITPGDWSLQRHHQVPAMARIAWFCWACRPYGLEFSEAALLYFARNHFGSEHRKVRKMDAAWRVLGEFHCQDGEPHEEAESHDEQAVA